MSDDLIKRSDAIDAIELVDWYHQNRNKDMVHGANSDEHQAWYKAEDVYKALEEVPSADRPQGWIPCSERLPSEEERKEWIDNNLDGIGYLYPCLVTRYSSINPDRTKNNPYVAKHYYDGEDFVNCGEEVCSEYILAWMPLPKPWKGADDE